jgi:hypothetical protein
VSLLLAASACSTEVVVHNNGAGGSGGQDLAPTGGPCGDDICGTDEVCVDVAGDCGVGEQLQCLAKSLALGPCDSDGLVCSCSGEVVPLCELPVDQITNAATCTLPPNSYACGSIVCPGAGFCFATGDLADEYNHACRPIPDTCDTEVNCDCLEKSITMSCDYGIDCHQQSDGSFTFVCNNDIW